MKVSEQDLTRMQSLVHDKILEKVCPLCVDRTTEGPPCEIDGKLCCVFLHLDNMLKAVLSTQSENLLPYIKKVRSVVCTACEHPDEQGFCPTRAESFCALNNYAPLLIEAIEEVAYA